MDWLRSGKVEVRRFEDGFLHGKAFLVSADPGVLSGSSNFTYSGLARNLELNLGQYQPDTVEKVQEWFEGLWARAAPFDLAAIYEERFLAHNPYLIYLRMLFERYGDEIEREASAIGTGIHLTSFQKDGVWRAKRILGDRHGVLVADDVGLGKSFIAGELIREAIQDRRQRVLLIAPAALRDGPWRRFQEKHNLYIECRSYEEIAQGRHAVEWDQYAMIVIDEAHGYRNPGTERAASLRDVLKGSPPKDLVMLTATPVNNSLWDLYYLLGYFIRNDAAFANAGVRSLRDHFAEAMALDPDDLSPDRLFDILDAVAVRRTRHFVKKYYPHDRVEIDGELMPIVFPDPVVRKVEYDLDAVMPGFFERFAHALDCSNGHCDHEGATAANPVLHLARYQPSKYRARGGEVETHELQMGGLLRSGLLKRFESSSYAFAQTCRRMADSYVAFLDLLDQGRVASGEELAEWIATDSDEDESVMRRLPRGAEPASLFNVEELRRDAEEDLALLLAFADEAAAIAADDDPKLASLLEELSEIAADAATEGVGEQDTRNKRKVIVFSYYADTIDWIQRFLEVQVARDPALAPYRDRVVVVTGDAGDRADAMFGFAPHTSEAPPGREEDKYDVLLATDVLAEGVNLQQARHIVNYDLPWNPMRLVQRHGRIDRIGSPHSRVFIRCFFPDARLDDLLGLEERLQRKITQAAASVGVSGEVIPGSKIEEHVFAETREQIAKLEGQDTAIFETGGEIGTAFSGEEYRQELRGGMEDPRTSELVKSLAWGSGSGLARVGVRPGFVFCARVGDHPEPQFRWVAADDVSVVVGDTLSCLSAAHATADTPRSLSEGAHARAYDAWASAKADILDRWLTASDPANLQPKVPKTMRDAADLLRTDPPPSVTVPELDDILNAIEAPYGERILKVVREAMTTEGTGPERALAVVSAVRELGLEPAHAPEPLPVIDGSDVHLVCWIAIEAN
ncbi:MAG: helicase-related protein [Actinomycetota bacterium]